MTSATDQLFHRYYYDRTSFVGGTQQFHTLLSDHIQTGANILEIGAGPRNATSRALANIGRVAGIDISDEVLGNDYLAEATVYDGVNIPFPVGTFDACVADFVLEHVQYPARCLAEVARVLRPGAVFCFRTPNQWHYVAAASRLLPHSMHRIANRLRGLDADSHEPYPTFYRCNTKRRIMKLAKASGLEVLRMSYIEPEPSYGRAHPLLFYPMLAYERLVNVSSAMEPFRVNILAVLRRGADTCKPAAAQRNSLHVTPGSGTERTCE